MGMIKKLNKTINKVNKSLELLNNPLSIGSDNNIYIGTIKTPFFISPSNNPLISITGKGTLKTCIIWQQGCEINIKSDLQITLFLRYEDELIRAKGMDSIRKKMEDFGNAFYIHFKSEAINRTIEYQKSKPMVNQNNENSELTEFVKEKLLYHILQVLYRERSAGGLLFQMQLLKECSYFNDEDLCCINTILYPAEIFLLNTFY